VVADSDAGFVYCASLVVNSRLDENRTIAEILLLGRRGESGGSPWLRDAQTLKRGASRSSTDVRDYDQFKNGDTRKFNSIFFDLASRVRWAEIPLLAHNFSKRVSAIRRPPQDKLLGTRCRGFFENEGDASELLRLIEEQPDRLSSGTSCTPTLRFS
jgi:hypothetical protein